MNKFILLFLMINLVHAQGQNNKPKKEQTNSNTLKNQRNDIIIEFLKPMAF